MISLRLQYFLIKSRNIKIISKINSIFFLNICLQFVLSESMFKFRAIYFSAQIFQSSAQSNRGKRQQRFWLPKYNQLAINCFNCWQFGMFTKTTLLEFLKTFYLISTWKFKQIQRNFVISNRIRKRNPEDAMWV